MVCRVIGLAKKLDCFKAGVVDSRVPLPDVAITHGVRADVTGDAVSGTDLYCCGKREKRVAVDQLR